MAKRRRSHISKTYTEIAHKVENNEMMALIQRAQAYVPRFCVMTFAVDCPVNCARFATPLFECCQIMQSIWLMIQTKDENAGGM